MQRLVARLAVCLAMLVVAGVGAAQALAAGPVVVSQVYGGGGNAGATYKNDFIELHNRSASTVDLSGWSVQYGSSGGTSWASTPLSGTLAAGGTYLIQESAGSGGTVDLSSPDAVGTIAMSATAGKVALVSGTTALSGACPTVGVVDVVGYGPATNCFETAPTPSLSNTKAALRNGSGAQDTDNNAADFTVGEPSPRGGGGGGGTVTPLKIDQIQGSGQFSPHTGETVSTTGIVTALKSFGTARGYFLQDPAPDADPQTSEGIFVFTGSVTPSVTVGDGVQVSGRVSEFVPSSAPDDLPETELVSATTTVQSVANATPAPVVIGAGGLQPPTSSVLDGIAFDESLEGMLVQLNDLQSTSATNSFGELWIVPDNGAGASPLTPRGGIIITPGDFNPEKFRVDDDVSAGQMPVVNVDAHSPGAHVGVMDYAFDNYTIHLLDAPSFQASPLVKETTSVAGDPANLSVATFNVENLAPSDPDTKYAGLADVLVNRLRAPDIVALEEVQDNTGATDDGTVDSSVTLAKLSDAVVAAGGPRYDYRWVNPVDDQDGGQPGGNIRVVFFFRTDVPWLSFAPGTAGGPTDANSVVGSGDATTLQFNPGRVDPSSPAWDSSRKPLAGEFLFNGTPVFVIANHFTSKLGDDPLWGQHQPPVNGSEPQRHEQAHEVATFTSSVLAANPDANVVVLGDLNDFQFSDTLHILEGSGLHDLLDDLPANEQYTYVFDGNSQAIDHLLVGGGLASVPRAYDVVHVNSEFADQVSDHDPQVASFTLKPSAESICALVTSWAKNAGEANSLCVKLRHGQVEAFRHEVDAQTGKAFTADQAATLEALAASL
jgi:predicted extracellular nuclease